MTESAQMEISVLKQRIDSGTFSPYQALVVLLCFLINVIDGFDVIAMSYAAPSLVKEWGIEASQLGLIFSSALVGMTIGAMGLSPLADRYGRRKLILVSVGLTSLFMLATPLAESVGQLAFVRFVTGLGIGGVLAAVVALTSEYASSKHASLAVIIVQSGYAVGSVVGGLAAGVILQGGGWEQIFWFGGIITGVLFFAAFLYLPDSLDFLASSDAVPEERLRRINRILSRMNKEPLTRLPESDLKQRADDGSVMALWGEYQSITIKLWSIFFAGVWLTYFLLNWIPVLFVNSGFSQVEGINALTFYTLGALVGAQILGLASSRISLEKMIFFTFLTTIVWLIIFALLETDSALVINALVVTIGFTFAAGFTALYAVSAKAYPSHLRSTGVGWCIGVGRLGAILSPLVTGVLVSAGWTMSELILAIAIPPLLIAIYFVWALDRDLKHRAQ